MAHGKDDGEKEVKGTTGGDDKSTDKKEPKVKPRVPIWMNIMITILLLVMAIPLSLWVASSRKQPSDDASGRNSTPDKSAKDGKTTDDADKARQVVVVDGSEREVVYVLPRVKFSYVDPDGFRSGVATIQQVTASDPAFRTGFNLPDELGLRQRGSIDPSLLGGGPRGTIDELLEGKIEGKIKPVKDQVDRVETKVGQLELKVVEVGETTKKILERLSPAPVQPTGVAPSGAAPAPGTVQPPVVVPPAVEPNSGSASATAAPPAGISSASVTPPATSSDPTTQPGGTSPGLGGSTPSADSGLTNPSPQVLPAQTQPPVSLNGTAGAGFAVINGPIEIRQGVEAEYSALNSSFNRGTKQRYIWATSDGKTGAGLKFKHVFSTPGPHVVTLTTKDESYTSVGSAELPVKVIPPDGPSQGLATGQ